jgi:threonine dehydratase
MTLNRATITEAATRIAPFIRRTPVMDIAVPGIENPVCLKLELFQHTGSFKPRGAFTNLVGAKIPKAGIAAASGGNHGAAVAYAAKVLGIKARIFVPTISSPAKIAALRAMAQPLCRRAPIIRKPWGFARIMSVKAAP